MEFISLNCCRCLDTAPGCGRKGCKEGVLMALRGEKEVCEVQRLLYMCPRFDAL